MTASENKTLYRRFYDELLNRGNFAIIDELVAPDVVTHSGFAGQKPGAAGLKEAMVQFRGAFPDLHAEGLDFIAESDRVAGRFRVTGTHRGEFLGKPASGKRVEYDEFVIVRFHDGRIAEHWSVVDSLALLQQLGWVEMK